MCSFKLREIFERKSLFKSFYIYSYSSSVPNYNLSVLTGECGNGKFKCISSGLCIPEEWKCDNTADCQDLSDELNCTSMSFILSLHMEMDMYFG